MEDILVNSIGLSVRATNALKMMQIHTLEQLLNTPIDEIRKGKNIGAKTIVEIENFCKSYLDDDVDIDTLVKKKSAKERRASSVYENLLAAGQRLLAVIKRSEGGTNKDLAKFTNQIQNLCDKWDR